MPLWDDTGNENLGSPSGLVGHTLVCPFVQPTMGKLKFTLQRLFTESGLVLLG